MSKIVINIEGDSAAEVRAEIQKLFSIQEVSYHISSTPKTVSGLPPCEECGQRPQAKGLRCCLECSETPEEPRRPAAEHLVNQGVDPAEAKHRVTGAKSIEDADPTTPKRRGRKPGTKNKPKEEVSGKTNGATHTPVAVQGNPFDDDDTPVPDDDEPVDDAPPVVTDPPKIPVVASKAGQGIAEKPAAKHTAATPQYTEEDLNKALRAVNAKYSVQGIRAVMSQFGKRKIPDVPKDQYPAFMEACAKQMQQPLPA